jgi:rhamnosyltransferase
MAVVVPTFRAASSWNALTAAIAQQNFPANQVLIVDSNSEDGTSQAAIAAGFAVTSIAQSDFNHGGTRQRAAEQLPWAKIVIFLTQDAIPLPGAFDALLSVFDDPTVGAAFGRQLPHRGAGPIEAHARNFNYPAESRVMNFESRYTLGIKATFLSNSFAAYRVAALQQVGGFPTNVIMAEDAIVAARLLMNGWKTAYVADAQVFHSHAYTITQEFRRYFDTGVYHTRESWLRETFGKPQSEGRRFVLSELSSLLPHHLYLVPPTVLRTVAKYIGYQLGLHEATLGKKWSQRLSYHTSYWDSPHNKHQP